MTPEQGRHRCIEQHLDIEATNPDAPFYPESWAKQFGMDLEEFLSRVERLRASRLSLAPPNKLDDFGGGK